MRKLYISKIKSYKDGNIVVCFCILTKFQGFGFLASFDNPTFGVQEYMLFDFRFLYLKIWIQVFRKIKGC